MRHCRLSWAFYALLFAFLAGCGGSTSPEDDDGGGSDGSVGGTGGSIPPVVGGGNGTARLGSLDVDGNFLTGTIAADRSTLTAGQDTTLTVALVDSDDVPIPDPVDVSFTSPCTTAGLAGLEPAVVANSSGRVTSTYTARGCDGADTVTATTVVNGATLDATVALETEAAPPGSILFDSATPPAIGIKGAGGALPEQSTVSFIATDTTGNPAPNQHVNFRLNTTVGGIDLSNDQAVSDADGRVATTVSSGTIATSVRVTATTITSAGTTLEAVSNTLAITTGIPDNDSFTIGAETLNIEGWENNGVTTQITALLADRFNNPVPDNTAVTFNAEGGSIQGSCLTEGGQCTVTFTSQNPRPADGRVTILATAVGEESFTDANPSNGQYEVAESFVDLPEAFLDDNENGFRDADEFYVDFDSSGDYTFGNDRFTGAQCNSGCDPAGTLNVRDSVVVVLSGSSLFVKTTPSTIDLDSGVQPVTVTVEDARGQVAPAGTTVSVEATHGTLIGPSDYTVANTAEGDDFLFQLEPGGEPGSGLFMVTVTTPAGIITRGATDIIQNSPPLAGTSLRHDDFRRAYE